MSLVIIGINHRTAPVKVREKFSFTSKKLDECFMKLKGLPLMSGAVVLSTCNRTEIYFDIPVERKHIDYKKIKSIIFDIYNAEEGDIERYFYIMEGADAIRHIFRVASGLDSQVLGETQILGQVRSAWLLAHDKGITSDRLNRIFKKAHEAGKTVRAKTGISQGNISIGSVAINMLEQRFNDLQEYSVLIIGAGKIGTLVSKYLREKNMRGIFVASRTYLRALELAGSCAGRAVNFCRLEEELKSVDIVISSTSSPHIVLKKEVVALAMSTRTKPLFIMDLALPRDVDPAVKEITGVSLYDLDDLKCTVSGNQNKKKEEALLAEKIVEGELDSFLGLAQEVNKKSALQTISGYVNLTAYELK